MKPHLWAAVALAIALSSALTGFITPAEAVCSDCDGQTVTVDQSVLVNLNPATPTCSGDADLCAYFTYDKSGATADKWKAIFNVSGKRLLIKTGAVVTVVDVPTTGGERGSPGIHIISTCDLGVELGGAIVVDSVNRQAGDITLDIGGNVSINGTISNIDTGTGGKPGNVTISSCCGTISTGNMSLIQTAGVDPGGAGINITTCCSGGDIIIKGLVEASYKGGAAPTINVVASNGSITIDGNTFLGIESGTQRRITTGVVVRSTNDPVPGRINLQARDDITVLGNTILQWQYPNCGAVAVKTGSNSAVGGTIDVRSTGGNIIASDRAFDNANRFNTNAINNLFAKGSITLSSTGRSNSVQSGDPLLMAVVSTRAGSSGTGGTNTLRSYGGGISIGSKAQVLADGTASGTNLLTSCTGIINLGSILPADLNAFDDSGACTPSEPLPLFQGCCISGSLCQCMAEEECGNGAVEGSEECDDGNTDNFDACRNDCTLPYCGDGIADAGEQCDDGNTNNLDSCRNDCTLPYCGDGILDVGEACDDGNANNLDGCRNGCTLPYCGDGIVDAGEGCDDGNNANGDGCSASCADEYCGDGAVNNLPFEVCELPGTLNSLLCAQSTQDCDAMNRTGTRDAYGNCNGACGCNPDNFTYACVKGSCGATCAVDADCNDNNTHTADNCDLSECACIHTYIPYCGDGIVDAGEGCDDGNNANGDGCSAVCLNEYCGDGVVNNLPFEICELPNTLNNLLCSQTMQNCDSMNRTGTRDAYGNCDAFCGCVPDSFTYNCVKGSCGAECAVDPDCGPDTCSTTFGDFCNGTKLTEYDSDKILDSTTVTGSADNYCSGGCTCTDNEASCPAPPTNQYCVKGVCGAACAADADCDDPDMHTADSCNLSGCQCEHVPIPYCGDGTVNQPSEECDDNNTNNFDGCRNSCILPKCGDDIKDPAEECDDGNAADGDGCSSNCTYECPRSGSPHLSDGTYVKHVNLCYKVGDDPGPEQEEHFRGSLYAFTGEQIEYLFVVRDYNGSLNIGHAKADVNGVHEALANPARLPETCDGLGATNPATDKAFHILLTVEPQWYGDSEITISVMDSFGDERLLAHNENWFFNPSISLDVSTSDGMPIRFEPLPYGADEDSERWVHSLNKIMIKNTAQGGVNMWMYIAATNLYDPTGASKCPVSNVLKLEKNMFYRGWSGTQWQSGEGWTQLNAYNQNDGCGMYGTCYGGTPVPDIPPMCNILTNQGTLEIELKLHYPKPCVGSFSQGTIYIFGKAF